MLLVRYRYYLLCMILLVISPLPARAIPTITCHCFTDRSFDPSRPAAADSYFLAATQNSFIAVVFGVEKKSIVMKKQQGTSPDDLWVAYWVAWKSGGSPEALLQARHKEPWSDIIAALKIPAPSLGARFSKALVTNSASDSLAEAVVDELLSGYQLLGDTELAALRTAGASNQEVILAALLAAKTGQSADQLYFLVKNGAKTWGFLLQGAKINPAELQKELSSHLKGHPR